MHIIVSAAPRWYCIVDTMAQSLYSQGLKTEQKVWRLVYAIKLWLLVAHGSVLVARGTARKVSQSVICKRHVS